MILIAAAASFVLYIAYRLLQVDSHPPGIPRFGEPGFKGYIATAIRFALDAETCIDEGWAQFSGRPFMIPTLAGPIIVLGPEHVEILRSSNDTVFNQPKAANDLIQMEYTMDKHQYLNPYHVSVVRTDVTRAINSFIPDILDETKLAVAGTFELPADSKSITVPVFHTMTHMAARIANRAMLGTELCRNDKYLHSIVEYCETLFIYATILHYLPRAVRSAAYFVLSSIFGGKKEPAKFIVPFLKQSLREREESDERPNNVAELLIRNSPPTESLDNLTMRVINLNFASIHTTSTFLTQALFELASLPPSDIDSIRTEVIDALEAEGGWTKAALVRFHKIDSVLKEVGRIHGVFELGLSRVTTQAAPLPSGVVVPAGYTVAIYLKAIHHNPDLYPNPHVFDPFRFSRLREQVHDEELDAKWAFSTADRTYLPFGSGRHACPGRFFVAMELKVILAHFLLNYDFSFPEGVNERPKNIVLNNIVCPDGKAKMVFTPRVGREVCLG